MTAPASPAADQPIEAAMTDEGEAMTGMNVKEALDHLVAMALGHDYADDTKIFEAEDELIRALGDAYTVAAREDSR